MLRSTLASAKAWELRPIKRLPFEDTRSKDRALET